MKCPYTTNGLEIVFFVRVDEMCGSCDIPKPSLSRYGDKPTQKKGVCLCHNGIENNYLKTFATYALGLLLSLLVILIGRSHESV